MRGRRWETWMDQVLRERYAEEENAVLARELGVGMRSVTRHARVLGLEKSVSFCRRAQERARRGSEMWYEYMRITGQKVGNHGAPGRKFEKGHRWDAETEARRVGAIRARSEDERKRILRGQRRATGWPMVDYATGKKA